MARTDIEWIGRVENLNTKDWQRDGRTGTWTGFNLLIPKVVNGESKEAKWYVTSFNNLGITQGDLFRVGIDLERRKKKDSEEWETVLVAKYALPYPEEGQEPKKAPASAPNRPSYGYSAPKTSPAPARPTFSREEPKTAPQATPAPAPAQAADTSDPRGPEFFEDDIPF